MFNIFKKKANNRRRRTQRHQRESGDWLSNHTPTIGWAVVIIFSLLFFWAFETLDRFGDSIGVPYFALYMIMVLLLVGIGVFFVIRGFILMYKGLKYERLEERYGRTDLRSGRRQD